MSRLHHYVLQEVDIEKELGIELGHDDDDEAEDDKHEGMHCSRLLSESTRTCFMMLNMSAARLCLRVVYVATHVARSRIWLVQACIVSWHLSLHQSIHNNLLCCQSTCLAVLQTWGPHIVLQRKRLPHQQLKQSQQQQQESQQ